MPTRGWPICRALSGAHRVDELKDIRDEAAAMSRFA
jgi:hypothetical protein